jgi:hypothetical protein
MIVDAEGEEDHPPVIASDLLQAESLAVKGDRNDEISHVEDDVSER